MLKEHLLQKRLCDEGQWGNKTTPPLLADRRMGGQLLLGLKSPAVWFLADVLIFFFNFHFEIIDLLAT